MKALLPMTVLLAALPSWLHMPTWAERWMWNPRERTATAIASYAEHPEAAVRPLETAMRLAPEDATTQFNAGTANLAAGNGRAAVAALERAAKSAPPALQPATQYNLGSAQLAAGDAAGAVAALKQAVRLAPDSEDAKWNLELALRELERQRQAKQPQETPGGERQGEQEQGGGGGAESPAQPDQPPQPSDAQPDPGQGPQPSAPQSPGAAQKPGRLPRFEEQPDMNAEQAAALLEAVDNVERDRRRREAARRSQEQRAGAEKDW